MNSLVRRKWSRREFLRRLSLTGVGLFGLDARRTSAESPPETTTFKLNRSASICTAPKYVAEDFLRAEGVTDVHYVRTPGGRGTAQALASGQIDASITFSGPLLMEIDDGDPIVVLAGVHPGCFELFGADRVHRIGDLRGKTVAVRELGSSQHIFLSAMAAYVGLDPHRDITWVTHPRAEAMRLLAEAASQRAGCRPGRPGSPRWR